MLASPSGHLPARLHAAQSLRHVILMIGSFLGGAARLAPIRFINEPSATELCFERHAQPTEAAEGPALTLVEGPKGWALVTLPVCYKTTRGHSRAGVLVNGEAGPFLRYPSLSIRYDTGEFHEQLCSSCVTAA